MTTTLIILYLIVGLVTATALCYACYNSDEHALGDIDEDDLLIGNIIAVLGWPLILCIFIIGFLPEWIAKTIKDRRNKDTDNNDSSDA